MSFIGIDLGTTFSAVATIDKTGRPVIIHNSDGENITPSCVTEIEDGKFEVGEYARKTWGNAPDEAAARFKRNMGTDNDFAINSKSLTPTELSALVIQKLVQDAKREVGDISEAVITVPANFANDARDATMAAANSVNLNVKYIINEPTAAALYYAFKNGEDLHGNYAVYDLGGGTFDVSIIRVDGQDIEVLASNGVSKLGGDDFDKALRDIIFTKYKELTGEDLDEDDFTINDAEDEKKSLSKRKKITVKVNRKLIDLSREDFEEVISTYVTQTEMLCESTIDEAGLVPSDIRAVFLAGGSTRIPIVHKSIERVFEQEPISSVNVDEVVALGAALYAAYKGDREKLSVTQKNAIEKIKLKEVASHCFGTISIGINENREQERLINSIIINKNEKIPFSKTKSFFTAYDGQEVISCKVTQCTAPESDPRFVNIIWEGDLSLPADRPEGQEIQITYSYDDNQMMKCSFKDMETGRETQIEISTLSEQENINNIERFTVE
tara:strand:- start:6993 stop:8486 length:1494 start_codon:yes stop_codon:yes gene_type:complete